MDATEERIGAINFANSPRGKFIISQALNYAIKHLRKLEDRKKKKNQALQKKKVLYLAILKKNLNKHTM